MPNQLFTAAWVCKKFLLELSYAMSAIKPLVSRRKRTDLMGFDITVERVEGLDIDEAARVIEHAALRMAKVLKSRRMKRFYELEIPVFVETGSRCTSKDLGLSAAYTTHFDPIHREMISRFSVLGAPCR